MNVLNKRTFMIVAVAAVVIGMARKYARDPANKDSFITKIVEPIGLAS
jgi:hypothetical protein